MARTCIGVTGIQCETKICAAARCCWVNSHGLTAQGFPGDWGRLCYLWRMPARCGTEDLAALRRLARELGMPVSTLIRVACRSYLREKTGELT